MNIQWLRRMAAIVAAGFFVAIVVTEIELALGVDLIDAPFFHSPREAIALAAAVLLLAAFQSGRAGVARGRAASVVAFGLIVLPFNTLVERPPLSLDFWRGNTTLRVDRTMTISRPHAVVLEMGGSQQVDLKALARAASGAGPPPLQGTPTVVVARLSGEPRSAFAVLPDKDEPKPLTPAGALRWTWTAIPRQEGPHGLVLELETHVKEGGADKVGNLYRQLIVITVQGLSWYEVARKSLLDLVGA